MGFSIVCLSHIQNHFDLKKKKQTVIVMSCDIINGAKNVDCAKGPKGPKGAKGSKGSKGRKGNRGEKGPTGPFGPEGAAGAPAEVSLSNLNMTTSRLFVRSSHVNPFLISGVILRQPPLAFYVSANGTSTGAMLTVRATFSGEGVNNTATFNFQARNTIPSQGWNLNFRARLNPPDVNGNSLVALWCRCTQGAPNIFRAAVPLIAVNNPAFVRPFAFLRNFSIEISNVGTSTIMTLNEFPF